VAAMSPTANSRAVAVRARPMLNGDVLDSCMCLSLLRWRRAGNSTAGSPVVRVATMRANARQRIVGTTEMRAGALCVEVRNGGAWALGFVRRPRAICHVRR
jgi:hypothetical protein